MFSGFNILDNKKSEDILDTIQISSLRPTKHHSSLSSTSASASKEPTSRHKNTVSHGKKVLFYFFNFDNFFSVLMAIYLYFNYSSNYRKT